MIYVVSDLHGYPLERFKKLLALANFGKDDFLFILGDVIDRNGDGGVRMLIWLMMQDNAQLILGNHEIMLLSCDFLFDEITNETVNTLDPEKIDALRDYLICGGDITIKNLQKLPKSTRRDILDYLMDCPLYETVSAGKRDFLLVHAGLKDFDPNKKMSDYSAHDLIWARPGFNDFYFDDIEVTITDIDGNIVCNDCKNFCGVNEACFDLHLYEHGIYTLCVMIDGMSYQGNFEL